MLRLIKLAFADRIAEVEPILGPRDTAHRRLWVTPEFEDWHSGLEQRGIEPEGPVSFEEQIGIVFADFVAGRKLIANGNLTRCDPPTNEGIWRLKTPDLRLYGWSPYKNAMVIVTGALKADLVADENERDSQHGQEVVRVRRQLDLDDEWLGGEIYEAFPAKD